MEATIPLPNITSTNRRRGGEAGDDPLISVKAAFF